MVQSYWIYNYRSIRRRFIFIFMVQSYNAMLMLQYYIFLSNDFNSIKETLVQSCCFSNNISPGNRRYPPHFYTFSFLY